MKTPGAKWTLLSFLSIFIFWATAFLVTGKVYVSHLQLWNLDITTTRFADCLLSVFLFGPAAWFIAKFWERMTKSPVYSEDGRGITLLLFIVSVFYPFFGTVYGFALSFSSVWLFWMIVIFAGFEALYLAIAYACHRSEELITDLVILFPYMLGAVAVISLLAGFPYFFLAIICLTILPTIAATLIVIACLLVYWFFRLLFAVINWANREGNHRAVTKTC